jgi:hypothetical protein
MKTTIFNLSAIILLVTTSFFAGRIEFPSSELMLSNDQTLEQCEYLGEQNVITRATIYEGEIIPMVDLPEFTVKASESPEHLVTAKLVNGELLPFVNLPTLSIEG